VTKTGGTVEVFGYDIDRALSHAKSCIGLVPQEINFNQFEKVFTIIVNQAGFYGIPRRQALERAERYLRQLQLWDKHNHIARSLSGGMKRRVMIAQALVHKPRVVVLDEPTAGVDVELRQSLWDFIRRLHREGHTIVLTTHYLEEAEALCGRIAILNHGELIALDDKQALLARGIGRSRRLCVTTRAPVTALPASLARRLRRQEGNRLEFELPHNDDSVLGIVDALRAHGAEIADLATEAVDLEDVFVELTRRRPT
jgi:ABC-2 type transport system ATP-binding protein